MQPEKEGIVAPRSEQHPSHQQATAQVNRIAGGVRYRWIPREENQVADTLAGGQLAQAETSFVYAEHPGVSQWLRHSPSRSPVSIRRTK